MRAVVCDRVVNEVLRWKMMHGNGGDDDEARRDASWNIGKKDERKIELSSEWAD